MGNWRVTWWLLLVFVRGSLGLGPAPRLVPAPPERGCRCGEAAVPGPQCGLGGDGWGTLPGLMGEVVPPWDAGLEDSQLAGWREAERELGLERSLKAWLTAKARCKEQPQMQFNHPHVQLDAQYV